MNFYKILFYNFLILGSLIAISSYSWLSMWMGLEINLLSIIPLMVSNKNIFSSESALKYFITQTIASVILLFSLILLMFSIEWMENFNLYGMLMMNSMFLTKMGAAPFHFWFPEIIDGLNWTNCFIMLTWQKFAPIILMMLNCKITLFMIMIIIFSMLTSGLMGFNQISIRKVLAYSSINHIGWMISTMMISLNLLMTYYFIYILITINIIYMFSKSNIYFISQLLMNFKNNKILSVFIMMNFLSLGGLPPFLGFYPKWLTINMLIENNFLGLTVIMVILTLFTLYFYLRLTFNTMMLNYLENKTKSFEISQFYMILLNSVNLMGLILFTFFLNLT